MLIRKTASELKPRRLKNISIMKRTILLINLLLFLLISCKRQIIENKSNAQIINIDLENIVKPDFKKTISQIDIVPLELNESSMIGNLNKTKKLLYIPNKYYVVVDNRYIINVFDMKGKHISSSTECIGEGPKDYSIFQDLTYNYDNDTFVVLDAYGNLITYDFLFKFISKKKIECQSKEKIRNIYAVNKHTYILFDTTEKGIFYVYDPIKDKLLKKVNYQGMIAFQTSVNSPFYRSNTDLYFTPPEINNYLFMFDEQNNDLYPLYYLEGNENSIAKKDLDQFEQEGEEISKYILLDCPKYSPINRLFNKKHIVSTYLKEQELFINFCNLSTKKNTTYYKRKDVSPNFPNFFALEDNALIAIVNPFDIDKYIDIDLVNNKNIISSINEEDNPLIVKYYLQ